MTCTYGISRTEVHDSVDYIRNSINSHPDFEIKFPSCHDGQRDIADGFRNLSKADINWCVGCIDGILMWILKPSEEECRKAHVGSGNFFCRRKKKFGLNLQAVCDHRKRFLHISILFPAFPSDFLEFKTKN